MYVDVASTVDVVVGVGRFKQLQPLERSELEKLARAGGSEAVDCPVVVDVVVAAWVELVVVRDEVIVLRDEVEVEVLRDEVEVLRVELVVVVLRVELELEAVVVVWMDVLVVARRTSCPSA